MARRKGAPADARFVRAAVLGADVSRSLSPALHEAAWRSLGLRGTYDAISVDGARFTATVQRLRREGYRYVNVTMPHKAAAARLADVRAPPVRATGAANTLWLASAGIRAFNTDGEGLLRALAMLGLRRLRGRRVVVVGTGGAAAAAVAALDGAGAEVSVVARHPNRAPSGVARFPLSPEGLRRALPGAVALISAVPARAWPASLARRACSVLGPRALVFEMPYGEDSPLGAAARRHRRRYSDGLPMLIHQAAAAVGCVLGRRPSIARMRGPVRRPAA